MVNPGFLSKEVVVEAVVNSIENTQTDAEIRTLHLKGYNQPEEITSEDKQSGSYIPDVEFRYEDHVELYEIELDTEIQLYKWKLFSRYTQKRKGNLNIVTQKENLSRFRELLKSHNIPAKLIYF